MNYAISDIENNSVREAGPGKSTAREPKAQFAQLPAGSLIIGLVHGLTDGLLIEVDSGLPPPPGTPPADSSPQLPLRRESAGCSVAGVQ